MTFKYNFGDLPAAQSEYANSTAVIVPVPYDETSTWGKGADKGPGAILEASANMELYDIETDTEVWQKGIHTCPAVTEKTSPENMTRAVNARVSELLKDKKFPVTIGGEHSVSIGAVGGCASAFDNLTVLQLDAHADLRDEYEDSRYNHACVMARAKEEAEIFQVGIRSMAAEESEVMDRANVIFAHQVYEDRQWQQKALNKLAGNVYISIDLDCFDPSIMPSTGTPEPGGLGWYETIGFLKSVIEKCNVVGFDVVELCPVSQNRSPDFLAAKLIYKMLSYKFAL